MNSPAITIAVILDSPIGLHQGGQVCAPVFKRIAEQVLEYLHVPHDADVKNPMRQNLRASAKDEDLADESSDRLSPPLQMAEADATSNSSAEDKFAGNRREREGAGRSRCRRRELGSVSFRRAANTIFDRDGDRAGFASIAAAQRGRAGRPARDRGSRRGQRSDGAVFPRQTAALGGGIGPAIRIGDQRHRQRHRAPAVACARQPSFVRTKDHGAVHALAALLR